MKRFRPNNNNYTFYAFHVLTRKHNMKKHTIQGVDKILETLGN